MTDKSSAFVIDFTRRQAIILVGLKLAGIITWSWVWVLSPIWISALLAVVFMFLAKYLSS